MFSRSDLNQISSALSTRDTLSQIRDRQEGGLGSQTSTQQLYRPEGGGNKFDLKTSNGEIFMGPIIGKNKIFQLSDKMEEASLLEYTDKMTGQKHYGRVKKVDKESKNIEVEHLSDSEAANELRLNPRTKVYELRDDDTTNYSGSGIMRSLMGMLDPSENILFKLMTLLLVGNIFKSESASEVFFAVYIRVVGLAVTVIAVMYLSMLVMG